jgi:excisionase family DNA binding protein
MEKIYTVKEVAEYFKVSKQTVHNWIYQKKLNTTSTPGGELRITETEIKKIINRG